MTRLIGIGAAAAVLLASAASLGAAERISSRGGFPVVAGDPGAGRFVVAWTASTAVRLRVVASNGRPRGAEHLIARPGGDFIGAVTAAYLSATHRVLVAWAAGARDGSRMAIYDRMVTLSGRFAGPVRRLTPRGVVVDGAQLAASDRGFLLGYSARDAAARTSTPTVLAVSRRGIPTTPPRALASPAFGAEAVPSWQPRARRFVVLLANVRDLGDGQIDYRLLTRECLPVGDTATFEATPSTMPGVMLAVPAPRGRGWVAVWSEQTLASPFAPLRTRAIDGSGTLGPARTLPGSLGDSAPSLAYRPGAGRGLLSFTRRVGCQEEIHALTLSATGAPIGHGRPVTALSAPSCPNDNGAADLGALAPTTLGYLLAFSGVRPRSRRDELYAEPLGG